MFLQSNSVAQTHTNGLSRVLLQGSQKQQSPEQIVLVLLAVTLAYLALPLLTFPAMLNVVRVAKKGFFFFFLLLAVKVLQEGRRNDPLSLSHLGLSGLGLAAVPSLVNLGFIYVRLILGCLCQAYVYSC